MRNITLRAGESITIGDTIIRAIERSSASNGTTSNTPISNRSIPFGRAGYASLENTSSGLLDFINDQAPDNQVDFARRCGTTIGYMRLIAYGKRRCGESLAINIDRETGGTISMQTLRPDVEWGHVRQPSREDGGVHA